MSKTDARKAVDYAFSENHIEFKNSIAAAIKPKIDATIREKTLDVSSNILNDPIPEINKLPPSGKENFTDEIHVKEKSSKVRKIKIVREKDKPNEKYIETDEDVQLRKVIDNLIKSLG